MTKAGDLLISFEYKGKERPKTTCIIRNSTGDVLANISVKKSVNDVADKKVGRFYAFRKAMSQLSMNNSTTREQRTNAWNEFTNVVKLPMQFQNAKKVLTVV